MAGCISATLAVSRTDVVLAAVQSPDQFQRYLSSFSRLPYPFHSFLLPFHLCHTPLTNGLSAVTLMSQNITRSRAFQQRASMSLCLRWPQAFLMSTSPEAVLMKARRGRMHPVRGRRSMPSYSAPSCPTGLDQRSNLPGSLLDRRSTLGSQLGPNHTYVAHRFPPHRCRETRLRVVRAIYASPANLLVPSPRYWQSTHMHILKGPTRARAAKTNSHLRTICTYQQSHWKECAHQP